MFQQAMFDYNNFYNPPVIGDAKGKWVEKDMENRGKMWNTSGESLNFHETPEFWEGNSFASIYKRAYDM